MTRIGPWIITHSGRRFWPADPRPEDVALEDIAHALSMLCRFGGHVGTHYSVAEHSVRVANAIFAETGDPDLACEGLFHDAAEAYTGDATWPVKALLQPKYGELERPIDSAVRRRFSLAPSEPKTVKRFDLILLATEKRDLNTLPLETTPEWLASRGYRDIAEFVAMTEELFSVEREKLRAEEKWGDLGDIRPLPETLTPFATAKLAEERFLSVAEFLLLKAPRKDIPVEVPPAYCTVCGRALEPVRAIADGSPTLRGHHPCPDHPEAR